MNRIYKKVWNGLRQSVVVVSEASSSQAGRSRSNVGLVSAKTGLVAAISAAIALGSMQAGAETALQMDALSISDTVEVASIPTNVDEANGAASAVYVDTVLQNTAAGSAKTALLFASEDYSNEFLKESNRITQSMGFKGIQGVSGGVEVADGKHLVLVGEDSTQDGSADFAILDGDLIIHGQQTDVGDSVVTLGSYGTVNKTTGTLNDVYVGVAPDALGNTMSTGVLRVRNGDFSANKLYNGWRVYIGGNVEDGLPEDSTASLKVESLVLNGTSELHNWGTLKVGELSSGKGTHGAKILNKNKFTISKDSSLNGVIDNFGDFDVNGNLTLTSGILEENNQITLAVPSINRDNGDFYVTQNLTLTGIQQWADGAYAGGGFQNYGSVVANVLSVQGIYENYGETGVSATDLLSNGKIINHEGATFYSWLGLGIGVSGEQIGAEFVNDGTVQLIKDLWLNANGIVSGNGTLFAQRIHLVDPSARFDQKQLVLTGQGDSTSYSENNGEIKVNDLSAEEGVIPRLVNYSLLSANTINGLRIENGSSRNEEGKNGTIEIGTSANVVELDNYQGTVSGADEATLTAKTLQLSGGKIDVDTVKVTGAGEDSSVIQGGQLVADVMDLTGAELALFAGSMEIKEIKSIGATVNIKGNDWSMSENTPWFEGATINIGDSSNKIFLDRDTLGKNIVNLTNDASVTVDSLTSEAVITVGDNSKLTVTGDIALGSAPTLTLAGGTLVTDISEIFVIQTPSGDIPVDSEGNPIESGEVIGGLSTVTDLQEGIATGLNKNSTGSLVLQGKYSLGQTDTQINSVLTQAGFSTVDMNIQMSGENVGTEANLSTIKKILSEHQGEGAIIYANTTFHNRENSTDEYTTDFVNFNETIAQNKAFGFQNIEGASSVEVGAANHLYLVGFAGDLEYRDAKLLDGENTSITISAGQSSGSLTLGGFDDHFTYGWVDSIDITNEDDIALTVQNGEFGVKTLTATKAQLRDGAILHIEESVKLLDKLTLEAGTMLDTQAITFGTYGEIVNNGNVQVASATTVAGSGIENNGAMILQDDMTLTSNFTNTGDLDVMGKLTVNSNARFINQIQDNKKIMSLGAVTIDQNGVFEQISGTAEIVSLTNEGHWSMMGGSLTVNAFDGTGQGSWTMQGGNLTIDNYLANNEIYVQGGHLTVVSMGAQDVVVSGFANEEAIFQTMNKNPIGGHIAVAGNAHAIFGDNANVPGAPNAGARVTFSQQTVLGEGATLNVGSVTKAVVDATFGKDSVTIVNAGKLGMDKAAFVAGKTGQTLKVEEGSKLIIGNAKDQGNYVVTEGFDISDNFDAEGNWIGGWSDGVKIINQSGTGLGFDLEFKANAENGSIYVTTVLNDVETVYPDIGASSIANGAVRVEDDMSAGLSLVKDILSSEDLTVDQKTKAVNSITELGWASGALSVALSDVSTVTDSIDGHLSMATDSAKANGLWVDMLYSSQEADNMKADGHMKYGFETDSYGFIMGYDHQVGNSSVRLGAAFSYQKGDLGSTGDALKTTNDYNTFGFHGYGVWQSTDHINVLGSISYLRSSSDVEQQLDVAGHNKGTADIDTNVITAGARVEGIFSITQGVTVIPHIGARVIHADSGSFDTKVDGAKAFDNDADAATLFQMPIGVAVRMDKTLDNGWTVRPHADLTVIPQFGDTEQDIKVKVGAFADTVNGDVAGNFATKASLGLQVTKGNMTVGARYGFTAGDLGRQDHAFKVEVRHAF